VVTRQSLEVIFIVRRLGRQTLPDVSLVAIGLGELFGNSGASALEVCVSHDNVLDRLACLAYQIAKVYLKG
jgi:hypothetical protein